MFVLSNRIFSNVITKICINNRFCLVRFFFTKCIFFTHIHKFAFLFHFRIKHLSFTLSIRFVWFDFFYKMYFFLFTFTNLHFRFISESSTYPSHRRSGLSMLIFFYKMYFFLTNVLQKVYFHYRSEVTSFPSTNDFDAIKKE